MNEDFFRKLIERAGAKFVGLKSSAVLFRADENSPICSLYSWVLKNVGDVELALKSEREKQRAAQWELSAVSASQSN